MPSLGQRRYSACRAAYFPRTWPWTVPAMVIWAATVFLLNPPVWAVFICSVVIGGGIVQIRFVVWRRMHPRGQCAICKLARDLAATREAAKWN